MNVGIIGFAASGKTTLFNALTGSEAEVGGFAGRRVEPNLAVVKVPDSRVDRLVELFEPKKVVHATITYTDVQGLEASQGKSAASLEEGLLHAVGNCEALMAVVRGFEHGGVEPRIESDVESIHAELILSDQARVEQRSERIEKSIGKQAGDARKKLEEERAVLKKCHEALEAEQTLRGLDFSADEEKILRTFQFLTLKPLLIAVNLSEGELGSAKEWEAKVRSRGLPPSTEVVACCAQMEMEISRVEDEEERKEFLASYDIEEPMADRVIRLSYQTLGLITFFTAGPTEVHAWTLRGGSNAVKAAGTIHSDMERGFIRAEAIGWDELLRCGSIANAKKEGLVRTEGKTYLMRDGDVIEIRFSV